MAYTVRTDSFSDINLQERTALSEDVAEGALVLPVDSSQGYAVGNVVYVGLLSREGCERAVIDEVTDPSLGIESALVGAHSSYEPVTSVLGDQVRIYRAANVDGTVPADASFSVLATRSIDPDQQSTYYVDSVGSADFWYKSTYYNATTAAETPLSEAVAVRGSDFGHYASLSEIRGEAGFKNAYNLNDSVIDQQREAAEAEVNIAMTGVYTLPFATVPPIIKVITIKLAAGLLLLNAYGIDNTKGKALRDEARAALADLASGATDLPDDQGSATNSTDVSSWPNDSTATTPVRDGGSKPLFHIGDEF